MMKVNFLTMVIFASFKTILLEAIADTDCVSSPPNITITAYADADKIITAENELIISGKKKICPEYLSNLTAMLNAGNLDSNKLVLLIWLLGERHPSDTNSIEALIAHIDLKAEILDRKSFSSRWGFYPAKEALATAGPLATDSILLHLPSESVNVRRELLCQALKQLDAKDAYGYNMIHGQEIAEKQVRQLLADEKDSTKRAHLSAALKDLDK